MPIVSTVCALSILAGTSACQDYDPLHEVKSLVDCVTLVIKFEPQREAINSICRALFTIEVSSIPGFRKNLLCLRNEIARTENMQQARKVAQKCADDFPSARSIPMASWLLINSFPTPEQQQINQLKAQNERLEAAQREEQYARRVREINQEYKDRMAQIDADSQRAREIDRDYFNRMREIDAAARANRPINCNVFGNSISCN